MIGFGIGVNYGFGIGLNNGFGIGLNYGFGRSLVMIEETISLETLTFWLHDLLKEKVTEEERKIKRSKEKYFKSIRLKERINSWMNRENLKKWII